MDGPRRPIAADERSGVLRPAGLARFSAEWIEPADAVRDVVDTYWAVRWDLPPGEAVTQRVVEFPALTFSVEAGSVAAPFVVTAARRRAWMRVIEGRGSVFALRLRPGGLAVLSDLLPTDVDGELHLTPERDPRACDLLRRIRDEPSPELRALRSDELIGALLAERPLARPQSLANLAVDALTADPHVRRGRSVAAELGTSERSLQRALRSTLGMGPHAVARRIRLQEVVRRLSLDVDVATVVADLGYADQAHLINDFRGVVGITPGQYVHELRSGPAGS